MRASYRDTKDKFGRFNRWDTFCLDFCTPLPHTPPPPQRPLVPDVRSRRAADAFRPAALRRHAHHAASEPWRNATLACVGRDTSRLARANPERLLFRLASLFGLRVQIIGGRAIKSKMRRLAPGGLWHAHNTSAVEVWLADPPPPAALEPRRAAATLAGLSWRRKWGVLTRAPPHELEVPAPGVPSKPQPSSVGSPCVMWNASHGGGKENGAAGPQCLPVLRGRLRGSRGWVDKR